MNGPPQNVLLNFRLEFPKSYLTIYLSSGISEISYQMVSTLGPWENDSSLPTSRTFPLDLVSQKSRLVSKSKKPTDSSSK